MISIPIADQPAYDQLAVGIQRSPRPDVASEIDGRLHRRDVLLLGRAERPNLVDLNALGAQLRTFSSWKVMHTLPASSRIFATVLNDTYADPRDRPHGRSLAEHGEDLDALLYGQLVHTHNI